MSATATRIEPRPARWCLVAVTGARVAPEVVETAIARAGAEHDRLHVVIPAVLPPTLPVSAMPAHLAELVNGLHRVALDALRRLGGRGRVEIVPGRDVRSIMLAAASGRVEEVVFAGSAGWSLRRAARAIAPGMSVPSERATAKPPLHGVAVTER